MNYSMITFYNRDGSVKETEPLTPDNLGKTNGMMIKCHLSDGTETTGFADPFRTKFDYDGIVHDRIYLWIWAHLDEKTHKLTGDAETKYDQLFKAVDIDKILAVEAILFSNPRWGGPLTNDYFVDA